MFVLTPVVLNELLCACLLAPFASTNLRAKPAAWVYGTDASKSRAGIVRTPVNEAVSRELWRLSEFAGWHSRLPSPLRVYLDDFEQWSLAASRARGDPADSSDSEVDLSSPEPGIAPALSEGVLCDCAEVFRGDGGPLQGGRLGRRDEVRDGVEVLCSQGVQQVRGRLTYTLLDAKLEVWSPLNEVFCGLRAENLTPARFAKQG